jgi:hypothetical protein
MKIDRIFAHRVELPLLSYAHPYSQCPYLAFWSIGC